MTFTAPDTAAAMNAAGFTTFGAWDFEQQDDGSWFGMNTATGKTREFTSTATMRAWMKMSAFA